MALFAEAPGFATPSTLYHSSGDTSALTTLQATLELGGPKESLTGEQFAA